MSAERGEEVRDAVGLQELSAGVVHGIYRVVKACQFHADVTNDAVTALTASAVQGIADYCAKSNTETVALSFLGDAIFVNRQILKASRDTHALAAELREYLEVCGVTELTLSRTIDRAAISMFAKLLADVQRERVLVPKITANTIPGINAGKAMFAASGASREESPGQRAARTYATSVLTVQSVLGEVRRGKFELPRRVKRVAQQVVARADEDARLLVALAATGGSSNDAATVAVGSAILSVAMARQLTTDRAVLANAAMTALLYDAGRVMLAFSGDGPQRMLNDDELDRVPARTVAALTSLGRMHAPARARTALLYEVWSMRRAHRLGAVYKGRRPPTLLARIIGVSRAFAELRGAGAGGGLSVDDALQMLSSRAADGTERALVKLLIGALGIYPAGTMVTLNTGELGVVMGTPQKPVDYVRPPVKILYDAHANILESPIDIDLAAALPGQVMRFIVKAVDADEKQTKAMRAFVTAEQASMRRASVVMGVVGRPFREPTLQSMPDDGVGVTKRPPVPVLDAASLSTSPPHGFEPISPPPMRAPNFGEPTPRSGSMPVSAARSQMPSSETAASEASTKPPAPATGSGRPQRQRRRDPRNDSAPPSSMQDEIHAPVRIMKPAPRMVPAQGPLPAISSVPPQIITPIVPAAIALFEMAEKEENDAETLRPPSTENVSGPLELEEAHDEPLAELEEIHESRPPLESLPPLSLPPLDHYEELPRFDNPDLDDLQAAPAAPNESETRPTASHDAMLAAFLNDAPLTNPPPPAELEVVQTEPPPASDDQRPTVVPKKP